MKTLHRLLVAGFLLASTAALRAESSARTWLETYYLNPQPALVPQAINELSRTGYFDRRENVAVAMGFFGSLFARHPDRVTAWLREVDAHVPDAHQRLLAAALWQGGHPLAAEALQLVGQKSPFRDDVARLASLPAQSIVDTPVLSPSSMRLQWGAFLATGDERHVLSVLDAFGLHEPRLNTAARLSLAENAAAHPRIMEICRAQLDRQPEEIRAELRAALSQAETTAAPRS